MKLLFLGVLLALTNFNAFGAESVEVKTEKSTIEIKDNYLNSLNLTLGTSRPCGENSGGIPMRFNYGVEAEHKLLSNLLVGVFVTRNNDEISSGSVVDISIVRVGAMASFYPTHESFLNVRAGKSFLKASATIGTTSIASTPDSSPFFIGPGAGLDIPLVANLKFSPSLHYDFFIKTSDVEAFNAIDAMATLKYQF